MELRKEFNQYLYEEGNTVGRCALLQRKWIYKYLHFKTWLEAWNGEKEKTNMKKSCPKFY